VTGARKKKSECFSQESALWPSVISLDALPLSYRKLVGVKITNLGSCNKHLCTYCQDWNIDLCLCAMIEIRWWILSLVNTWERCFFQSVSDTDGSEEKIRILPLGAKPLTFWLLLQALYHKATGDSCKLSPFLASSVKQEKPVWLQARGKRYCSVFFLLQKGTGKNLKGSMKEWLKNNNIPRF